MGSLAATVLAVTLLATGGQAGQGAPTPTAGEIYKAAYAREQDLRDAGSPAPTVREYRLIVIEYDNLVRRYPQSGYADDALWQGGVLSSDAFERFGEERDRSTARRMLELLVNGYPYSPYVTRAKAALKKLAEMRAAAPPATTRPAAPPAAVSTPSPAPATPPPAAAASENAVTLRSVTRTAMPDRVRVTLDLDGATTYRSERVEDPPRVLVDIRDTQPGPGVAAGQLTYTDSAATHVRIGAQSNRVTRVVVTLDGVSSYRISTIDQPYRIIIECERARPVTLPPETVTPPAPKPGKTVAMAPGVPPLPAHQIRRDATALPALETIDAELLHQPPAPPETVKATPLTAPSAGAAGALPLAGGKPPVAPPAPGAGSRGPYSMSRQLGLGVSKIVIDPGHGGHDPGALGAGVSEAEVVLDVALRLEKLLKEAGITVVLTRRSDEYVPLEERPAIARREQADLFLSIHANASRVKSVRGVETYFLNLSTDPAAEEVAARENAATSHTINNLPDILKAITLNNKLDESRAFAGLIQKAMARQLSGANSGLKDLGVKQAPFVVLIGAEMPSVLVEIAFITNPQEGKLLKNGAYRQRIAQALFDAVKGYQRSLKGEPAASLRH